RGACRHDVAQRNFRDTELATRIVCSVGKRNPAPANFPRDFCAIPSVFLKTASQGEKFYQSFAPAQLMDPRTFYCADYRRRLASHVHEADGYLGRFHIFGHALRDVRFQLLDRQATYFDAAEQGQSNITTAADQY